MKKWLTGSSFVRKMVMDTLSNFATVSAGFLIAHGILTGTQETGYIGSVCFLGSIAWDAFVNRNEVAATFSRDARLKTLSDRANGQDRIA